MPADLVAGTSEETHSLSTESQSAFRVQAGPHALDSTVTPADEIL